ncbi:MAG: hypothetical protein A2W03_12755 [Candidatus Aminicenantes bacterium RBG_16_63_16]|nr:MAG: hypothetical protein A2W03_12755 [Candidatus Aminicenantes bacterium RBG_16_63_16]
MNKMTRGRTKNKILLLAVVFSSLTCSGKLMAKERRGAELVITKADGQQIIGELIAVKQGSLLLLDSRSGTDLSVNVGDLRDVKIVKKSKFWQGAGVGLLAGAFFGAALVNAQEQAGGWLMSKGESIAIGAIMFAGPCAVIGG